MFKKILIVEDETTQRHMLSQLVKRKMKLIPITAKNGREGLDILAQEEHDISIILMDLNMPVMSGTETLPVMAEQYPDIPVIMLTGSREVDDAVNAMKNGATDFINKPFEPDRLVITIENALKINTLKQEVKRLKQEKDGAFKFENLIGYAGGLSRSIELGRKIASSDIPALITGPTGSGKELFSRAIHGESKRTNHPFIAVNCGAIPSQLVESTLFGHEKGAFTGATDNMPGKFREAHGGTIFLDEVGELPLETQVKLLRVLQQKEVETVGAAHPIPIDVRIISATNRDLEQEVKEGNFREDLYFRLNVMEINLPSLKERPQDIIPLAHHFIERFAANEAKPPVSLNNGAGNILQNHHWPGNVRQLENTINRAMVLCEEDELNESHFQNLSGTNQNTTTLKTAPAPPGNRQSSGPYAHESGTLKTMDEIEKEAMIHALNTHNQNTTRAAKALGIAKSTFYRKMAEFNAGK